MMPAHTKHIGMNAQGGTVAAARCIDCPFLDNRLTNELLDYKHD